MQRGLREEQAKQYACSSGLILGGFTVTSDHSIVLCERGAEHTYSRKRMAEQERKARKELTL